MISEEELEDALLSTCVGFNVVIRAVEDVVPVERMPDKETTLESLKGISKKLWDIYEDVFQANVAKEEE